MGITTQIESEIGLTIQHCEGVVTMDELEAAIARYPGAGHVLWDFRAASMEEFTANALGELARRQRNIARPEGTRVALVMNDTVKFGLGRSFEAHAEFLGAPVNVRTFRDYNEALVWIESDE